MQQTTVNALKAIGEAPISDYTDEWKKVQIPDYNTDFDTTILEIYATKSVIAIDEVIGFHIVTSIELVEVEWDFGDGEVSSQKDNILKSCKCALSPASAQSGIESNFIYFSHISRQ